MRWRCRRGVGQIEQARCIRSGDRTSVLAHPRNKSFSIVIEAATLTLFASIATAPDGGPAALAVSFFTLAYDELDKVFLFFTGYSEGGRTTWAYRY